MSRPIVTVAIDAASDGTGATPAVAAFQRDDQYYLDAIAERWMKDTNRYQNGVSYTLAQLPVGYAGFSKGRDGSKHVDRYMYGHPNGIFRSMNELYPHFKHLQDNSGPIGCPCKLCTGKKPASRHSGSPASAHRGSAPRVGRPKKQRQSSGMPDQSLNSDMPSRRKQVDDEGSEDVYRKLLDKLKEAGQTGVQLAFIDQASPDWRTGHELVESLLTSAQEASQYEPRLGELVMFDRAASASEGMAWDHSTQSLRKFHAVSQEWLDFPKWEAGIITQVPVERISDEDLNQMSRTKKQGVTYSGYRVEALTPLSLSKEKPITSLHKYAPLHAIRPFSFWKECMKDPSQVPGTVDYAMKVASSFSIIGKQRFEGQWPEATLYVKGVYIGPELILVGDAVRLVPGEGESQITDIMVVGSIRIRFVNLEEANDDEYDDDQPYHTCLHISGKAFSLNPKKSFQGQSPTSPGKGGLPKNLAKYGQWYSILDPAKPKARLEVPFSKVLGKCFEDMAMDAWWSRDPSQAADMKAINGKGKAIDLSQGLAAMLEARLISTQNDPRIDKANGKSWFWAETRIEQLDLHEINDRFVGLRDEGRDKTQLRTWRQALRILDGKRSSFDAYYEARKERQEQEQQAVETNAAFGMMGGAIQHDSGEDVDMAGLQLDGELKNEYDQGPVETESTQFGALQDESGGEAMEVAYNSDVQELAPPVKIPQVVIDVSSDEDELMVH